MHADRLNVTNEDGLTRQMHSDAKKRRSFVALLFAAGDLQR